MSVLHKLERVMFTTDNINSFFLKPMPLKKQSFSKPKQKVSNEVMSDMFIPKFDDTLFWCYYIMKYGLSQYTMISHNFKEEQKIKIEAVELIREKREKLKRGKFKRIKTENDLVYKKKMSVRTFLCLCYMHDMNVFIIDDNKYMERVIYDQANITVIKRENERYGIYSCDKDKIQSFREIFWKVDDMAKPLKKFSNYKAKELRNICKKLNINIYNEKKGIFNMKKLYELITQKI